MILLRLFWAFLTIGMVSFGGGYAMLPLFERMIVVEQGWLSSSLFIDMIALSQVTPGPIAVNSATFIGFQIAGVLGSLFSTIGVVFVPVLLIAIVSRFSEQFKRSKTVKAILKGLRPALVGLIFASVFSIAKSSIEDIYGIFLVFFLLFLLMRAKLHPILVIVLSGVIGMIIYL